jgi:hypothetical protein
MVDFKPHKLVDTISALKNMHGIDRVFIVRRNIFCSNQWRKYLGEYQTTVTIKVI